MPQTRQYGHPFMNVRVPRPLKERIEGAAASKGYGERDRSEFARSLWEVGLAHVDEVPDKAVEAATASAA